MNLYHPYTIFPLGDSALIIDFGNTIDPTINTKVLQLFHQLQRVSVSYITDLVPAYSSLAIYYDILAMPYLKEKTAFEMVAEIVERISSAKHDIIKIESRLMEVPVCYSKQFAPDIQYIAQQKKISVEEIIFLHTSKTYRVYMIGFLPGFSYMGEVDDKIAIPRKAQPQNVMPGAVGIAGTQTGIYPLESPGGWQIIGRTPLKLFEKNRPQPVLFDPGDTVKFFSITEDEFTNY